jgi:hypothetical protein
VEKNAEEGQNKRRESKSEAVKTVAASTNKLAESKEVAGEKIIKKEKIESGKVSLSPQFPSYFECFLILV